MKKILDYNYYLFAEKFSAIEKEKVMYCLRMKLGKKRRSDNTVNDNVSIYQSTKLAKEQIQLHSKSQQYSSDRYPEI